MTSGLPARASRQRGRCRAQLDLLRGDDDRSSRIR
jgi:hypothetical protein